MAKTQSAVADVLSLADLKRVEAKDELNFAEFPIALLADRAPAGVSSLEFRDTIRDSQSGEMVTRRVIIDAPNRLGLPTASDDEVILGLIQLTKLRNNFTERQVFFSRYELIHLLGWPNHGASYKRLEQSLNRWISVTLDYQRAWWDRKAKSWVDEKFHILERVSLYETAKEIGKPVLPFSSFVWNEVVFNSFQAGYLKSLNLDFYLELRLATARRMYRFLDKRFYHKTRWEFDLADFAFEHIGMSRTSCQTKAKGGKAYVSLSKVKEKLSPGIEELEAKGFLERLSPDSRYLQERRGEWKIVLARKGDKPPAPADVRAANPLVELLVAQGVTAKVAGELVAAQLPEAIERQLDVLAWKLEQPGSDEMQNPGGWLAAAIRDGYAPPKGYIPKDERERKTRTAAAAKAKLQRDREEKGRQELAETAAKKVRTKHVDAFLQGLSEADRLALEERAIASAEAHEQKVIRQKAPGSSMIRRFLIEREVLRVCPMLS